MTWSAGANSNMSAAAIDQLTQGTFYATNGGTSYSADTIYCALYGNTGTPNKNDTLVNNTYVSGAGSGQWVSTSSGTNEVFQAVQFPQGGVALGTKTHTFGSGTSQIGAASVVSGATATLAAVYGCLVYDGTLTAKYAYCWNYFGGSQSVTSGTFTVVWSGSGIMQFTIT